MKAKSADEDQPEKVGSKVRQVHTHVKHIIIIVTSYCFSDPNDRI
jgi:hypothetical protein